MISLSLRNANPFFKVENFITGISGKKYEIGERIGAGGNAVVHKCQEEVSGDEFAVKILLNITDQWAKERLARFEIEIKVLKEIKHYQLTEYIDEGWLTATKEQESGKLRYVIMPLAKSNLMEYMKNHKVSYDEYVSQFKGLAQALAELQKKAIHRDIKPENILIRGDAWLLSDFGLCKFIEDGGADLTGKREQVGPRYWNSPEGVNRIMGCGDEICKQSDVFQLCSIFWYVVNGRYPAGVIMRSDWKGPDHLFNVIYDSLAHDLTKRPVDAEKLYTLLQEASESV